MRDRTAALRGILHQPARELLYLVSPSRRFNRRTANAILRSGDSGLVLDIGGGSNEWMRSDRHKRFVLEVARSDSTDVLASAYALPFATASIRYVVLLEVLEHLADPGCALREAKRVMLPDGEVVLSVPFVLGRHDHVDYYRWTREGMRKLLTDSGFSPQIDFWARGRLPSTIVSLCINAVYESLGRERLSWRLAEIPGVRFIVGSIVALPLMLLHNAVWWGEGLFARREPSTPSGYVVRARKV